MYVYCNVVMRPMIIVAGKLDQHHDAAVQVWGLVEDSDTNAGQFFPQD
jgi:hypothetical protein